MMWIAESRGTHKGLERWRFRSVNSQRCLDRGGGHNMAAVFQWKCNESASQLWYLDGGRLRNELDQRCLDITDASQQDGALLAMWTCRSSWHQRWTMTTAPGS
jgi:glucosylceramidase